MEIEKKDFLEAGVHFGSLARYWNPKMEPFIHKKVGKKIHFLDYQKIVKSFLDTKARLEEEILKKENVIILFVGTNTNLAECIKQAAIGCNSPYMTYRWLGGFLTNFSIIKSRINFLNQRLAKRDSLSSREQAKLEKDLKKYEGVLNLKRKPDLIFIVGFNRERSAVKEAVSEGIPIAAICNTNCDPDLIEYPILGNDNNIKSVSFLVNAFAQIIKEAKVKNNFESPSRKTFRDSDTTGKGQF